MSIENVSTTYMYRLVHAFRAPSDLVPRRSRGTKLRVREKQILTDLVHGLHRKSNTISPWSSDNYLIMIELPKENIS